MVSEATKETPPGSARAEALLRDRLTDEQRADYDRRGAFTVTTPGGRRYRLHKNRATFQADLLARDGDMVLARYCVASKTGQEPRADLLLAQMLLLQSDEAGFLLLANEDLQVNEPYPWTTGERRQAATRPPIEDGTDYYNPPGRDFNAYRQQFEDTRGARTEAIIAAHPCDDHQRQAEHVQTSRDQRGLNLFYACGCPTRYVSFRGWEQRQTERPLRGVTYTGVAPTLAAGECVIPLDDYRRTVHDFAAAYNNQTRWERLAHRFPCTVDSCPLHAASETDDGRGMRLRYQCGAQQFVGYDVLQEE